jgi:hypothetical protein
MALTLISTHTASASATLDITSGIDSTYDSYEFHMVNMHPATDAAFFTFQVNADGLTGFDEFITSSQFDAYHHETEGGTALGYRTAGDQAQTQLYQRITLDTGFDADQSVSGILTLYAPSSPTYVKHFTANTNISNADNNTVNSYTAGYINTTNAIDEISFKFSAGNIDAGTIKMFGVS